MIPQKIQALFEFIDFLDKNKAEYIQKYIPLCNELKELDKQRSVLKPNENYKDKQSYDSIQKQIEEKFQPITDNIYKPITSKLRELGIWSGDDVYISIWNNNFSEISDFKRNFSEEDVKQIFQYEQKYLSFRAETNSDFLCISLILSNLDEILKELFNFFKDTNENEFDSFESKIIEVENFAEIVKNLKENIGKNVKYSIPSETIFGKKHTTPTTKTADIKNEFNVYNMRDKIEVGNISNNSGQITLGKDNKIDVNANDELSQKSYNWQKWGIIIGTILTIIGIIVAIIYSN